MSLFLVKLREQLTASGKGGVIPHSRSFFARISHPELLSSAIPNSVFFPHSVPYPNLGEFHSGSSQIPYPVDISRVPHLALIQPNPGFPDYPSTR